MSGRTEAPAMAVSPHIAFPVTHAKRLPAFRDLGRMPLSFERSRGQADPPVRFLARSGERSLFLTPSEAIFTLSGQAAKTPGKQAAREQERVFHSAPKEKIPSALHMQIVGADSSASVLEQQPLNTQNSDSRGRDTGKRHAEASMFGRVGFHGVYSGVDLIYYGNQRYL
jgi:hypothetical protein